MIAQLGMYDMPHAKHAHDALWTAIRDRLGYGPSDLTRGGNVWDIWQSPDLLLAQTCGLPLRARLYDHVQLIGTPDYGLPGCPAGYYQSVIVVRRDDPAQTLSDLAHRSMAYNEALSQSGWAAPVAHMADADVPFQVGPATGGHAFSAQAVATHQADFAALDALTWTMLARQEPDLHSLLRVLDRTTPTPGLPYITAKTTDAGRISAAVAGAIDTLDAPQKQILHLSALVQIPLSAYRAVPIPTAP